MKRKPAKPKKPASHPVKAWTWRQYRKLLEGYPWEEVDVTPKLRVAK